MSRYCKGCKHSVQEQYLYQDTRCPTCGTVLPAPSIMKMKRTKKVAKKMDIMVEYRDKATNEVKSVVYTDVTEEYYNKIKYTATNVIAVHDLTKEA